MGEVYRAEDLRLDQPVALKFLPASAGSDPAKLERFLSEAIVGLKVTFPTICRVYDSSTASSKAGLRWDKAYRPRLRGSTPSVAERSIAQRMLVPPTRVFAVASQGGSTAARSARRESLLDSADQKLYINTVHVRR